MRFKKVVQTITCFPNFLSWVVFAGIVYTFTGPSGVINMVLENMGLAPEQTAMVVALAIGINPLLDMFETACNVAGDNVCNYIVAHRSGMMDPEPPAPGTERVN